MLKAGCVIAVETASFFEEFGKPDETLYAGKRPVWKYKKDTYELYAIHSGAGEIFASMAAQLLISTYKIDMLFNFGVVGGLNESMALEKMCVVKEVVHYEFDTSEIDGCEPGRYLQYPSAAIPVNEKLLEAALRIEPSLKPVRCASGNRFVGDPAKKRELAEKYGAEICEMEAAGILLTADWNEVPCLMIKMVSDGVEGGAEEFARELENTGRKCAAILAKVLEEIAEDQ
ncbi:MAG: 5'-methylthioadenosine/S-adenosylhomocysteine nucleosidase [Erysipelotrichales bacterium]|nr:5'-methylthioadenosine/S-adenosylhomocysteine nucleosidase [Erysipelotrichales bacterium]MBQ2310526.1 5'-methylthioadenosine/S-adenosylhomocysteine nucleosidase [Erysipelotrichales bacterium]MBQ2478038.1 5'-methylthioadenosine/S-adenosylhomocysteine nucleosidase [Erysipelotrichales bacterium]MBQ4011273.1 5'-methylthioadenosine/S-adenosylhomocysteine nucleosidase [Erysipelotrichales bacterium]